MGQSDSRTKVHAFGINWKTLLMKMINSRESKLQTSSRKTHRIYKLFVKIRWMDEFNHVNNDV